MELFCSFLFPPLFEWYCILHLIRILSLFSISITLEEINEGNSLHIDVMNHIYKPSDAVHIWVSTLKQRVEVPTEENHSVLQVQPVWTLPVHRHLLNGDGCYNFDTQLR